MNQVLLVAIPAFVERGNRESMFSHNYFLISCVSKRRTLQGIHCPGKFLSERGKAEVMHSGWASEKVIPVKTIGFSLAAAMQERRKCLDIPKTRSIFGVANSGSCAQSW
jgi:hypothetical protein